MTLARHTTGVLLQRQTTAFGKAKDDVDTQALVADELMPARLSFGVMQVLNNVRSAISDLSAASADLAKTQRDTVRKLIGDLSAAVTKENEEAKKAAGAADVAALSAPLQTAAAAATADPHIAATQQLQDVYETCVAPST